MNKIIFAILLSVSSAICQTGEWKYIDGWVYVINTTNDATAGGAIIENKKEAKEEKYSTINGERYISVDERKSMGLINTNDIWKITIRNTPEGKNIRIPIPIDCKLVGLDKIGLKTPEPNSNSLLFIGFAFFLFIRSLKRNSIKYFRP